MSTQAKHSEGVMRADGARVVSDSQQLIALLGSEADAERMARAWNCHDGLVAACEAVIHQLERGEASDGDGRDLRFCIDTLKGALIYTQVEA